MSFLYSKLLPRHRRAIDVIATRRGHSQGPTKSKGGQRKGGNAIRWRSRQEKDPYVNRAKKMNVPSRAYFKLEELDRMQPSLRRKYARKKSRQLEPTSLRKRLIEPGALVLDLGAAPGGWSLYVSGQLSSKRGGGLVAVDLLSLDETLQSDKTDTFARIQSNLEHFEFIRGDFTEQETQLRILDAFSSMSGSDTTPSLDASNPTPKTRNPSLIMSDMAPNFTGNQQVDAIRTMNLCEQALAFAVGPDCFDESLERSSRAGGLLNPGGDFLCKFFKCGEQNERDLLEAAKRSFEYIDVVKPKASRRESSEQYLLALNYR